MYVCLCNALTDKDIYAAATRDGAQRPAEVFAACRCRAQCGSCIRTVRALIGGVLGDGDNAGMDKSGAMLASSGA